MNNFLTDEEFTLFSALIYDGSGIHFSTSNRPILESRLRERVKTAKLARVKDYYDLIRRDQEEMKTLLDSVTTNLTWFFRYEGHFTALENIVLPDLLKYKRSKSDHRLRVWSAGCSTGEEPYSIAMLLADKLPPDISLEVVGSDLSLKSLMVAKEGFYAESRVGGVPEKYLKRFLEVKNDGYQITENLKKLVRFDYHNLKFDSGLHDVDVIFCRNVIIYFDTAAQQQVVNRFWRTLTPHSFLFLGHSESLFGMDTKFEFVKTDWACLYRKAVDAGDAP
jgi:chemotaxis protein methyltransferase CheR